MTFIDIGAHYGLYALLASKKVGGSGKVIAFEPQNKLIPIIQKNFFINDCGNATVIHSAVGERMEMLTLFQPSATNPGMATLALDPTESHSEEVEQVPVDTLVNLLKNLDVEHIHGMKIDVEGAEYSVLRGAEPFFRKAEPHFLFIECIEQNLNRFGHSCQNVFTFLQDHGYRLIARRRNRWVTFTNSSEFREKTQASPDVIAIHPSTETWKKVNRLFQ